MYVESIDLHRNWKRKQKPQIFLNSPKVVFSLRSPFQITMHSAPLDMFIFLLPLPFVDNHCPGIEIAIILFVFIQMKSKDLKGTKIKKECSNQFFLLSKCVN